MPYVLVRGGGNEQSNSDRRWDAGCFGDRRAAASGADRGAEPGGYRTTAETGAEIGTEPGFTLYRCFRARNEPGLSPDIHFARPRWTCVGGWEAVLIWCVGITYARVCRHARPEYGVQHDTVRVRLHSAHTGIIGNTEKSRRSAQPSARRSKILPDRRAHG